MRSSKVLVPIQPPALSIVWRELLESAFTFQRNAYIPRRVKPSPRARVRVVESSSRLRALTVQLESRGSAQGESEGVGDRRVARSCCAQFRRDFRPIGPLFG